MADEFEARDFVGNPNPPVSAEGLATPAAPVKAVPPEQWPVWAKGIATFRTGDDKGVGDTAERNLGIVGEAVEATGKGVGGDCGCAAGKAKWDAMFPC